MEDENTNDDIPDDESVKTPSFLHPSWKPFLVVLVICIVWAIAVRLFGVFFDQHISARNAIATLLLGAFFAALGFTLIPRFVGSITTSFPKGREKSLRKIILALYAIIGIWFAVFLIIEVNDALHPVPVRKDGQLPNVVAIIGQDKHDVERILGDATFVTSEPSGDTTRSWSFGTSRETYTLPDLDRLDKRPLAKIQHDRAQELANTVFKGTSYENDQNPPGDAIVIVYYSQAGRAVGVRLQVSRLAVRETVGNDDHETILRSVGFQGDLAKVGPPAWELQAEKVVKKLGGAANRSNWGFGAVGNTWLGYELNVGQLSYLLLNGSPKAVPETDDLGDIQVEVAPNLIDWQAPPALGAQRQSAARSVKKARKSSTGPGKIAFVRDSNIWAMNPDGTDQQQLTVGFSDMSVPAWSPSGKYIAFAGKRGGAVGEMAHIWIMKADGSEQRSLTDKLNETESLAERSAPSWLPDDTEIAYTAWLSDGNHGSTAQFVVSIDDSKHYRLGDNVLMRGFTPLWSRTGRLVYEADGNESYLLANELPEALLTRDLFVADKLGETPRIITSPDLQSEVSPRWSPDGQKVLFFSSEVSSSQAPDESLAIMNADGSGRHKIISLGVKNQENATDQAEGGESADWSPDGKTVVFGAKGRLWTVGANGANRREIVDQASKPAWQPVP